MSYFLPGKRCHRCTHWHPFDQYYDDPEEPDDYGHCLQPFSGEDSMSGDDTCELWERHTALTDDGHEADAAREDGK